MSHIGKIAVVSLAFLLMGVGCTKKQSAAQTPVRTAPAPTQAEYESTVNSFESCIKAGNKAEGETPKRCMHDGKYYTEVTTIGFSSIFSNKIVYDMAQTSKARAEKDCAERSGAFKECGSPCKGGDEACAEMCVFTCEFFATQQGVQEYRPDLDRVLFPAQAARLGELLAVEEKVQSGDMVDQITFTKIAGLSYTITGSARGNWFFEASAPVSLYDVQGILLGSGIITAQKDWMTTGYVPFSGTLTVTLHGGVTVGDKATLVLAKDNPSGLPEYDKEVLVEVAL